eukprot:gb/GEZN01014023.1/.p1 GENE.gb/GEZN01014023.1/~~gb/GEZN01014023.1/.p1  ORF type:complete len:256 (+),score=22.91 gb/GEZN01014023.1/:187-954(+)
MESSSCPEMGQVSPSIISQFDDHSEGNPSQFLSTTKKYLSSLNQQSAASNHISYREALASRSRVRQLEEQVNRLTQRQSKISFMDSGSTSSGSHQPTTAESGIGLSTNSAALKHWVKGIRKKLALAEWKGAIDKVLPGTDHMHEIVGSMGEGVSPYPLWGKLYEEKILELMEQVTVVDERAVQHHLQLTRVQVILDDLTNRYDAKSTEAFKLRAELQRLQADLQSTCANYERMLQEHAEVVVHLQEKLASLHARQ